MNVFRLNMCVLAVALIDGSALAQSVTPKRLASELARAATMRVAVEPLTINGTEMATLLMEEAVRLDADNAERWQSVLNLALLTENESLRDRAVENILRLNPQHEPARLIRLSMAIERHQTFDARVVAYETLLREENVSRLGPAVASRLALEAALLHQRQGEVEQFSQWLTKSLTWDSSNRSAAAIAAGYFSMNVNDPVAEAELLVNLMLADPTDSGTHVELAQKLLEHGAFIGAERMYRLAIRNMIADVKEVADSLVVDHALSLWASGKDDEALTVLARRQAELDLQYRYFVQSEQPEMTIEEIRAVECPITPELAMVQAVIHASRTSGTERNPDPDALGTDVAASPPASDATPLDPDGSGSIANVEQSAADPDGPEWVARSIKAFQDSIAIANEMATLPEEERRGFIVSVELIAQDHLKLAWMALWMGVHTDQVEAWLAKAEDYQPLGSDAKARFQGWLMLRQGRLIDAADILAPLSSRDIAARLGMAHARWLQGNRADASREFLAIVREQPGSLIGIWAAARFREIVGTPVPQTQTAADMDHLVASISMQFDRYTDDPSLAVSVRVIPSKATYEPFEPITFTVEVTNHTPYPLSLDRNGPIRPQLLVHCSVRSSQLGGSGELRPFIIDLSRRLRLAARERLIFTFDLRDYWPGIVINAHALDGAIVRLRCLLNFGVNGAGVSEPRLYGQEVESPLIRVDGIRMQKDWIVTATEQLRSLDGDRLLEHLDLMTHRVAPRPAQVLPQDLKDVLYAARLALAEAFGTLDSVSQAWLLAVMKRGVGLAVEGLGPVHAIARKSNDRLVIISNMLFHADGSRDPMFEAAKRHDDAVVRRLAAILENDALMQEQQAPVPLPDSSSVPPEPPAP